MTGDGQLYFDDLKVGERFRSPARTLGEAAFLLFAGITGDNHPIHYDEEYARRTRFGGRVAHGLLLVAMTALGASSLAGRLHDSMVALADEGFRCLKPVLLGDTVQAEFEVAGLERRGDHGLVRLAVRLLNQRGEPVLEGHHAYLIRCR